MTITQNQYEAYVEAEDNYYLRRFTTREYATYDAVQLLLQSALNQIGSKEQKASIQGLITVYERLNFYNTTPQYRISLQTLTNSITSSTGFASLKRYIPSSNISAEVKSDILDIIRSIEDTPSFTPPGGIPNFYQTYKDQLITASGSSTSTSPTSGTSPTSTTIPTPTDKGPLATPSCYEKNGVVMTIREQSFYLKLLPAIQSNIPMQGSSETPNTAPGLHIKIIPNLARLRIPGFAPVYQHLGIDSALITLVGTFVPEDGENSESFTNVTGFAPPSNINDQTTYNQIRNSELERSSYLAASKFYDFAVKTGGEVSVYINVPENVNLDSNPFVLNKRPGFKGIIKSMDLFHRNRYRTWYTIQFEVSDFGMYSSTPLDMNQDINQAIQERIQAENQDRVEETQSSLTDRIGNKNLISYNDAENPGYFRSGNSYYFRFADPQSCRRTYRSALTILRCDDEQWVEISGIDEAQAKQFAQNTILPAEAQINYPPYETVRDIRRRGYQQFSSDGALIRQVDGSDITGVEYTNIVIQGGACLGSAVATNISAAGTVGAAASGVGAPAAVPLSATTIALGAAAAASCGTFVASSGSAVYEARFRAPDTNEGTLEGVILPIGVDLGAGLLGRAAAPVLKEIPGPIGNFFRGTSAAADDITITPPGTSQINPPINPPDPVTPPTGQATSLSSSASSPPVNNPRQASPLLDPATAGSNGPPSNFAPPTSPVVSATTKSISGDNINVFTVTGEFNEQASLNSIISKHNITELTVIKADNNFILEIDSSGNISGAEEAIDFISRNNGKLRFSSINGKGFLQ